MPRYSIINNTFHSQTSSKIDQLNDLHNLLADDVTIALSDRSTDLNNELQMLRERNFNFLDDSVKQIN